MVSLLGMPICPHEFVETDLGLLMVVKNGICVLMPTLFIFCIDPSCHHLIVENLFADGSKPKALQKLKAAWPGIRSPILPSQNTHIAKYRAITNENPDSSRFQTSLTVLPRHVSRVIFADRVKLDNYCEIKTGFQSLFWSNQ